MALAGFGITPSAMATAPIATQSKTPMVVMAAATSAITEASPYVVRTSFTLPQAAVGMAEWANKNGIKKTVTWWPTTAPASTPRSSLPTASPSTAARCWTSCARRCARPTSRPFLQKVRDAKPDALFVFLPSGQGAAFMKQFAERGLDKAGIRLIATGDVTDDDQLADMGDVALGVVTSHHYSAAHTRAP
jgi:branched-chain amino acid transport system substrate-binding protein